MQKFEITTDNENLKLLLTMAQIKSNFNKLGFKKFPSELIAESYNGKIKDYNKFFNKCNNCWNLRSVNAELINYYLDIYDKIKSE